MSTQPAGILERIVESNDQLVRELEALRARVRNLEDDRRLPKEWYTLVDCARLKGVSESALREKWRQPLGGHGRRQIAGLWRWHRADVERWLLQDDAVLFDAYLREQAVVQPAPGAA